MKYVLSAMVALLLLAAIPLVMTRDSVDLVELNHFYDDQGTPVFTQIIWYEWNAGRFDVVAWRLVKSRDILPIKQRADWVSRWRDVDIEREVRAKSYRESWTQYDPELLERTKLPKEKRTGLTR